MILAIKYVMYIFIDHMMGRHEIQTMKNSLSVGYDLLRSSFTIIMHPIQWSSDVCEGFLPSSGVE